MERKIKFTREELQILYAACIAYRDNLYDITKKIVGCSQAIAELTNMGHNCSELAIKITEYMEDD